jgi:alanine racemase
MDLMAIYLRGHPDARAGSPVVLRDKGWPIETVADASGAIACEQTCSITRCMRFVEAWSSRPNAVR